MQCAQTFRKLFHFYAVSCLFYSSTPSTVSVQTVSLPFKNSYAAYRISGTWYFPLPCLAIFIHGTLFGNRARAHTHTHVPHNLYSFHFLVAVVFFPDISAQDMVESLRSNILWGFPFARFSFRSTSFLPFILYEIVVLKGANNKKWSVLSIDNYCFKTSFFQLFVIVV